MKKNTKKRTTKKPKRDAPWTIRGVSQEARNAVRINARKEGITVGEWLDKAIWEQAKTQKPSAVGSTLEETLKTLTTTLERQNERLDKIEARKWWERLLSK